MTISESKQFITKRLSRVSRKRLIDIRDAAKERRVPFGGTMFNTGSIATCGCLAERIANRKNFPRDLSDAYYGLVMASFGTAFSHTEPLRQRRLVALINKELRERAQ